MQRHKTDLLANNPTAFLPKRGEAREEHYLPHTKEQFGLNKRSRRLAAAMAVTLPNGEYPKDGQ